MKINILDCTLRDGGYINNWEFSKQDITTIISSLESANIEIIECGYLNDKIKKASNSTLFSNIKHIEPYIKNINCKTVVMINLGDFDILNLIKQKDSNISGIRLAFHKKDTKVAFNSAKKIIELGYELYLQPMITKNYTEVEFTSLVKQANKLNIYSFYIVDSFGSMTQNEFNRYVSLADKELNSNILLGYHSHNNMQLAFGNAVNMCHLNIKRDIIIDSSIYGIGRGAGNLNSELITDYLNKIFNKGYNTLPLLEVIDNLLESLMQSNPWGFSPAQYLSASFNTHPSYAKYLLNKNTNHMVQIKQILSLLKDKDRSSFNIKAIEDIYEKFITKTKTPHKGNIDINNNKILLIASGNSTQKYKQQIQNKQNNYCIIALNHKPDFKCDYYFFSNEKRFNEFKNKLDSNKIIITSNIDSQNIDTILDISKLIYIDNKLINNVASIFINYLVVCGYKHLEIAGLDGYNVDSINNYSYKENSVILDKKSLHAQNNLMLYAISNLSKIIDIEFITPSLFQNATPLKILGVIPARYKSSRFEGKPLAIIAGIAMIKRTYTQAKKSKLLDNLVVATDDTKIEKYCKNENIPVVMTSINCLTGTDRLAQVAHMFHYDLYVNIQGDEPIIDPNSIDEIVNEFKKYGNKYMAYNLYKTINDESEMKNNTIIKVITNELDELMYMSRLNIPYNRSTKISTLKKQVCVYGFTKIGLKLFEEQKVKTINEQYEDIEILRFLDMGYLVKMKETKVDSIAVDVPEDIQKVENFLQQNRLV